jgi:hypothetical protein
MWVLCFFAAYFFIVGDAIKNPKEQKIAEENNGKETQKQPHSWKGFFLACVIPLAYNFFLVVCFH